MRPLLKALRSAAVMALPPKAAIAAAVEDEDTEGEAEDTVRAIEPRVVLVLEAYLDTVDILIRYIFLRNFLSAA